ncbi:MAG: hypothetical protein K2K19_07810, partial [Acetatifactor sp.]|nr:hypothetical protein [Acetatifactor sp.]
KLFEEHKQLADAFAEEYHIKTIPERPEDIDECRGTIKEMLVDSADLPYEEVKELLVKIAAFIGEKACEMCSYEWLFPTHFEEPEVVGKYPFPKFMPLNIVVNAWKYKCNAQSWKLIEIYGEVLKQGMTK